MGFVNAAFYQAGVRLRVRSYWLVRCTLDSRLSLSFPSGKLHKVIACSNRKLQSMVSVERGVEHAAANAKEKAQVEGIHTLAVANGKQAAADPKEPSTSRERPGRHQSLGHKSLLKSGNLYQYLLETSVYPRESPELRGLRELTAKHPWNIMTTSPDEGQFLNMLMKLMNAKNTMEIGVFTGYSLLSTALALPQDGKIWALDINRKNYELGFPFMEQAGVAHKIEFCEGPALETLEKLLQDEDMHGFFDFIFIDADKDNYLKYHELVLQLVRVGGVIGYDNTLWNGSLVAPEDEPLPKYVKFYKSYVLELNAVLSADQRIEISHLSISDGITLCRRVSLN